MQRYITKFKNIYIFTVNQTEEIANDDGEGSDHLLSIIWSRCKFSFTGATTHAPC